MLKVDYDKYCGKKNIVHSSTLTYENRILTNIKSLSAYMRVPYVTQNLCCKHGSPVAVFLFRCLYYIGKKYTLQ